MIAFFLSIWTLFFSSCLFFSSDEVTTSSNWSSAPLSSFALRTSIRIALFLYSSYTSVITTPLISDSLSPSRFTPFSAVSLAFSSMAPAQQDTDVWWAFLKGPRSSVLMLSLLSVSVLALRSPVLPLPQHLSLCLSPGLPPPIHITWLSEIDSLPKEWELEQMEYEWFSRVWKRCLGEGSGAGGPSIVS